MNFKLGNQIRTCPQADGTAEGEGVFSLSLESTNAQPNGTDTIHIEMRANARYKGQVGDSGYLEGPVTAEIDYTYKQTGSFRDPSGAIATPAGSDIQQHVTIQFGVSRGLDPPSLGAFSGGDPTKGRYGEAFSVGTALAYWAGVFYSVAQTKWMHVGECALIVFDPPSNSVQPVPGAQITVKAEVKTKGGESSKANFQDARARSGSVTPPGGASNVGSPIQFIYQAPTQQTSSAGFRVGAVSRAGAAEREWSASLGTGWSGQITCTFQNPGDQGHTELSTWSNSQLQRLTVDVSNGVGTATAYAEAHDVKINKRKKLSGETMFDQSHTTRGTAEGTSLAKVEVFLNEAKRTYHISMQLESSIEGKLHTVSCVRERACEESDSPLYLAEVCARTGLRGQYNDPNQLEGSVSEVDPNSTTGQTRTTTWRLARRGRTQ